MSSCTAHSRDRDHVQLHPGWTQPDPATPEPGTNPPIPDPDTTELAFFFDFFLVLDSDGKAVGCWLLFRARRNASKTKQFHIQPRLLWTHLCESRILGFSVRHLSRDDASIGCVGYRIGHLLRATCSLRKSLSPDMHELVAPSDPHQ